VLQFDPALASIQQQHETVMPVAFKIAATSKIGRIHLPSLSEQARIAVADNVTRNLFERTSPRLSRRRSNRDSTANVKKSGHHEEALDTHVASNIVIEKRRQWPATRRRPGQLLQFSSYVDILRGRAQTIERCAHRQFMKSSRCTVEAGLVAVSIYLG